VAIKGKTERISRFISTSKPQNALSKANLPRGIAPPSLIIIIILVIIRSWS
jgi:hypothetical protein